MNFSFLYKSDSKELLIMTSIVVEVVKLFLYLFIFEYVLLCFPGGEGDRTNHRGPDHEKGHATSFHQVRPIVLHCYKIMQW